MSNFVENLTVLRGKFEEAMEMPAGKGVTVADIFQALENLHAGKYEKLGDMTKENNFNNQTKVFVILRRMLEDMGTPVEDLVEVSRGKKKLEANAFAEELLASMGLELPTPKKREPKVEVTVEDTEATTVEEPEEVSVEDFEDELTV